MNTSKVKQLANSNRLDLIEETITINESGVDFRIAHATDHNKDQWILRFPRRPESMRHAEQEKKALDIIHQHASFEVPQWSIFSDEMIAYRQLSGAPAATIDAEKQDYVWNLDQTNVPPAFHQSLGKALAELHALPQQQFKQIGVDILSASELRNSMKQRMQRVKERYEVHPNRWDRWQAWLANDSLWPTHVGVKHGDLHPGHILINEINTVTGIIDWTEVGIGDVSVDFMSHQLLFGKDGLNKLIDAYDNAGGKTWSNMAEHIIELLSTSGITVAEYAEVSGLKEMEEAARVMLGGE